MVTRAMQGGDSRFPTFARSAKTPVLADSAGFSLIKWDLPKGVSAGCDMLSRGG